LSRRDYYLVSVAADPYVRFVSRNGRRLPEEEQCMNWITTSTPSDAPRPHWLRRAGKDSIYLLTGFPIAVVSFSVLVAAFATGASLLITLVGLPLIVLTWLAARQFARLERSRIAWVSGRPAPQPSYRPRTRGGLGALVDAALDPQAVRDFVHGIAVFAVSCVTWTVAVTWAAVAPITIAWFVSGDDAGSDGRRVPDWLGIDSHAGRGWLYAGAAVVCVVTLPLVIRGLTAVQVAFGRWLLTGPQAATPRVAVRELESASS
jgi:hypothetical protein